MFSLYRFQRKAVVGALRHFSKDRASKAVKFGATIVHENVPHKVTKITMGVRGKGGGFVKATLKNLVAGNTFEKTYTSDETVEIADMESIIATYSWTDGNNYMFMNSETYEEIPIAREDVDQPDWLDEGLEVKLSVFNNKIISVLLPNSHVYTVSKIDVSRMFDGLHRVVLNTGATIMVPQFIKDGDQIRINLHKEEYMERVGGNSVV